MFSSRSIRWRLQAWLAFFLVLLLTGFCLSVYHLERMGRMTRFDGELETRVSALSVALRGNGPPRGRGRPPEPPPPSGDFGRPAPPPSDFIHGPGRRPQGGPPIIKIPAETENLFQKEEGSDYYYYRIWVAGRQLASEGVPSDVSLPERASQETRLKFRTRQGYREAYHFTERGDCVLVGRSLSGENTVLNRFAWLLSGAGIGVLFIGIAGGWWLTGRAIRPIEEISETARRISGGNLAERDRKSVV